MNEFHEGELIIYQNGDRYEIGKIKRIVPGGAFVWYSEGDTAAKTPFDCIHKLTNGYTIKKTALGGDQANGQESDPEKETIGYAIKEISEQLQIKEDELAKTLVYINEIAETLLPQIDSHNMGVDDARDLLIYCGFGCDEFSPSGFIDWLGRRMKEDPRLRDAFLAAKSTIKRKRG